MSGEQDQTRWRGVQPVDGIRGVWPERNAERVGSNQLQAGVGVINVYTVSSGKRLFLTSAFLSSLVSVDVDARATLAVRDGSDAFQYYVLYHGFVLAGQQTSGMNYFPALEVEADWDVYVELNHASMVARGIIHGWLEDE